MIPHVRGGKRRAVKRPGARPLAGRGPRTVAGGTGLDWTSLNALAGHVHARDRRTDPKRSLVAASDLSVEAVGGWNVASHPSIHL